MSAIDKSLEVLEKVQKARRLYKGITLLFSSSTLLIALAVIIVVLLLIILLIPFIIFGEEEKMRYDPSMARWGWMEPKFIDTDGSAYVWPVPTISRITSYFGNRDIGEGAENHKGIDIADGAANTELVPIYAMAAGKIIDAGPAVGYGQVVIVEHENELLSVYGHLDWRMEVKVGDTVEKGQRIGRIGAGRVGRSTGPHLHFEIRLLGVKVNPLDYVKPPSAERYMPLELSYRPMRVDVTLKYLKSRNSALATESILQMIDRAGKEHNVDPHFLVAITGQEQSFVPANKKHADLIARNPWNVFGCWCSGKGAQLTTEESALIAAKTIVKLSQSRPAHVDPVYWLVSRDNPHGYYAEHTGWWIGVKKFYKAILEE
ncbi:M23 family peptidase [Paenibacillus pinisoli]|uniref:M23 family peptidase n=1 Tax=Paenibacillus pinisoli TaxID=1276110 RepID=A0A3A6PGM6_9BACL|nr:M23 family metallopeptidase [Paenibacillus pinisoli]RJX40942.1 M23 family peptidase [Paenibacillus pinisoli]